MTEEEWLAEDANHWPRLNCAIQKTVNSRKLILAAVSFCYPAMYLMKDERSKDAVIAAEKYADGEISKKELRAAYIAAHAVSLVNVSGAYIAYATTHIAGGIAHAAYNPVHIVNVAYNAANHVVNATAYYVTINDHPYYRSHVIANAAMASNTRKGQKQLVHCIFGNPFQVTKFDPNWMNDNASKLAQSVYIRKDFSLLSMLADELEENGCTDTQILNHCRNDKIHTRGCWVLDTILGKGT
jgi:hypothetical protein